MAWTCPECGRRFRHRNQMHECAPAMTLDEYFSTGPERERPIFDAVMAHLEALGPVHVEPLSVGILLKRSQTFVYLKPMKNWVALWFPLDRVEDHPRIARRDRSSARRTWHAVNVRSPDDLDDDVLAWLTEAYLDSPA
jgi:hypothetical protein